MKENALNIFVEDPLKELSEEVIQKMPQFDTFDEFAERMLPITRFNAKHRTLLKAVFSFLDHSVYCMTTNMLFYAITGSNERKATDVQRRAIYDLMSDMKSDIVCVGISCKDQMIASVGTALIAEVAIICEKKGIAEYRIQENALYQYYQKAVIHKENGIAKHIVQECVCWDY